jgi:mono/diheme cytochrome c family protein
MRRLLATLCLAAAACGDASETPESPDFPYEGGEDGGGKDDVFGRKLAGIASPYLADPNFPTDTRSNLRSRREAAWKTAAKILEDVPLLGLAETPDMAPTVDGVIPKVPRFETWYGIDDVKRIFIYLYGELGPSGRSAREPFTSEQIDRAFAFNATSLDRSDRWPLERYFAYVKALGQCPEGIPADECVRLVFQQTSGSVIGNARILYSPATVRHILQSYDTVIDCLAALDGVEQAATPEREDNFTACFHEELPPDAALIKAQWVRVEPGNTFPTFDTSATALTRRLAGTADWGDAGDRKTNPGADKIYTIRLRDGSSFRLAGLHIMTKEARHWQWITLWWSDKPKEDFGSDRPAVLANAARTPWRNYKMCTTAWYTEEDTRSAAQRYPGQTSLSSALKATSTVGKPTWCSNPYIEHGRGNASTNCIGCHQHGGATTTADHDGDGVNDRLVLEQIIDDENQYPLRGRAQLRQLFPADYLFSYNRVDDWAHIIASESAYFDRTDVEAARPRIDAVLARTGSASAGATQFAQTCARCHGPDGEGTGFAPSLYERVPKREDVSLVRTLIQGKGDMPAWGERFDDQRLADLLAHLRGKFGDFEE